MAESGCVSGGPSLNGLWDDPLPRPLPKYSAVRETTLIKALLSSTRCCSSDCLAPFRRPPLRTILLQWRRQWDRLPQLQQNQVLLDHYRALHIASGLDTLESSGVHGVQGSMLESSGVLGGQLESSGVHAVLGGQDGVQGGMLESSGVHGVRGVKRKIVVPPLPRCGHRLLQKSVCRKAFRQLVGCRDERIARARKDVARGHLKHGGRKRRNRPSHVMDAMHGAVMVLCLRMRERMPFRGSDQSQIHLPLARKRQLFALLQGWYLQRQRVPPPIGPLMTTQPPNEPLLPKPPEWRTFLDVLKRPAFAALRFHRVVDIGRCAKCCFYNWKLMTVGPEHRGAWEQLAAQHHWLQLSQKHAYSVDRAKAASDFPHSELYIGIDGGSGFDCCLPHLSAFATEGPNKAVDKHRTLPFKIMNGLVHGSSRSHVLLSPGSIIAVRALTNPPPPMPAPS